MFARCGRLVEAERAAGVQEPAGRSNGHRPVPPQTTERNVETGQGGGEQTCFWSSLFSTEEFLIAVSFFAGGSAVECRTTFFDPI